MVEFREFRKSMKNKHICVLVPNDGTLSEKDFLHARRLYFEHRRDKSLSTFFFACISLQNITYVCAKMSYMCSKCQIFLSELR